MSKRVLTISYTIDRRMIEYIIFFMMLCLLFLLSRGMVWQGTKDLHTIMEVAATLLALMVGVMALVHYYSQKDINILFIGAGFIGTSVLDGYHAVVTSYFFSPYLPTALPALSPWSWLVSRLFLSILLFLSWLMWKLEWGKGKPSHVQEKYVYTSITISTLFIFSVFAVIPLPRAYYPEFFMGRPEELLPAVFFILALVGYVRKGGWKEEDFEHWLVMALIINVASQIMFMPFSFGLFDTEFHIAHLLKKVSYIFVLIGLFLSMYSKFKKSERVTKELRSLTQQYKTSEVSSKQNEERIRTIFETVSDGIITTDETGLIQAFNPGAEKIFGYSQKEVIGQNIKLLMPENFARQHDTHMKNFRRGSGMSAIGRRRDLIGLRKDGTTFPMDLTINERPDTQKYRTITGVVRDITEEKIVAKNLEKHVEELKKTNADLEEFAYVASHDLKAPLRGIDNIAKFILEDIGEQLDETALGNFKMLQSRIYRMERLLNDLLNYSRADQMDYPLEYLDLEELMSDMIPLINARENFEISMHNEVESITTMRVPLCQMLMNIMGNAIKHHDQETGKVEVVITEEGQFIKFSISDDGPGIPEEFNERVFGMFQTLKTRDETEGSGMGLAIVKKVVLSLGGSIQLLSQKSGRGAHFIINWPKDLNTIIQETDV